MKYNHTIIISNGPKPAGWLPRCRHTTKSRNGRITVKVQPNSEWVDVLTPLHHITWQCTCNAWPRRSRIQTELRWWDNLCKLRSQFFHCHWYGTETSRLCILASSLLPGSDQRVKFIVYWQHLPEAKWGILCTPSDRSRRSRTSIQFLANNPPLLENVKKQGGLFATGGSDFRISF